ncbi:hypothetical protein P9986_02520 [Glaesserella parasuis]|uniref:hypothetical protein n=1 Tax=Glaesserella parasuis TaxID=738 RepID=UPI0024367634|nr:hypothetical protein [Glaesserella parasuis]MDG6326424.1 hypothetical protein [Glaesserella parasuis]
MFGLTKALERTAISLHSFSEKLDKFNDELPKKLLVSALKEKSDLISYMKLSEKEVDEILFNVRNDAEYKKRDELYRQQAEAYFLSLYRECYDIAKSQGLTVKEAEREADEIFELLRTQAHYNKSTK